MAKEDKPTTTKPNSLLDLERRQDEDYVSDLALGTVTVNPNPFGEEEYVGTDPIYQNHANKTEAPLASKSGAEKKAEDAHKEMFSTEGVDKENLVDDHGMGGKAVRSQDAAGAVTYLVPGQEGYDEKEQGGGAAVRTDAPNKSNSGNDDNNAPPPPPPTN